MSENRWLTLKLTRLGENTEESILTQNLLNIFGKNAEVFFPYISPQNNYSKKVFVLEGYVFVRPGPGIINIVALNKSYYFERLNNGFSYVGDSKINELRGKLKTLCEEPFNEGEYVIVTDGPYENMDGEILVVNQESVVIHIAVRSKIILVEVPKVSVCRYCP